MTEPVRTRSAPGPVPYAQRRWPTFLYMALLTLVFIGMFHRIKDEHVSLGGDNADYYVLAESIASGHGFSNVSLVDSPPHDHFPPGYPFLLALLMKVGISDIITLTWMNGLFLWAALMLLFIVFKRWSGDRELAAVSVLVCMVNAHLLGYSTIMMSEVPFLLCLAAMLFAYVSLGGARPGRDRVIWTAVLIVAAVWMLYIRTAGIAAVGAVGLHLLLTRRYKLAVLFAGLVLLTQVPWQLRSHALGGSSYARQLMSVNPYRPEQGTMKLSDWKDRVKDNTERYFFREVPSAVMPWNSRVAKFKIERSKEWPLAAAVAIAIGAGAFALGRWRSLLIPLLAFNGAILLLWPQVWTGPRFILPLIPLLVFLGLLSIHAGMRWVLQRAKWSPALAWVPVLPVVLLLLMSGNSAVLAKGRDFNRKRIAELGKEYLVKVDARTKQVYATCLKGLTLDRNSPYPEKFDEYIQVARWVGEHTPRDTSTVVCCRKPSLFHLFSGRYVAGFKKTLDPADLTKDLVDRKVSHVVIDQLGFADVGRYLFPVVQRDPAKFKLLHSVSARSNKKQVTYLFSFHPELGYTGAWKDGRKEGPGRYVGPDHSVFEGTWRNDTIVGQGRFVQADGMVIEGEWYNGRLNGHARYLRDGKVVQEGEFRNGAAVTSAKGATY